MTVAVLFAFCLGLIVGASLVSFMIGTIVVRSVKSLVEDPRFPSLITKSIVGGQRTVRTEPTFGTFRPIPTPAPPPSV